MSDEPSVIGMQTLNLRRGVSWQAMVPSSGGGKAGAPDSASGAPAGRAMAPRTFIHGGIVPDDLKDRY
jgi:hypothetical protein